MQILFDINIVKENLNLWIKESESRLDGLKNGELGSIDYSEIKAAKINKSVL